ncbi:hypothetical protein GW17_00012358 [Ensete ventricosum]|nr:hypothetical protein GW17_00012358 [Ensete ventricosum]
MATAVVEKKQPMEAEGEMCAPLLRARGGGGEGLRQYYLQHIHDLHLQIRQKTNNLQRLEAQRNDLNSRGSETLTLANSSCTVCSRCPNPGASFDLKLRALREELQLLQEPGSYVGEVVKVMGKSKVLVKVHPEGKYVVDIDKSIDITKLTPSTRVALRNDSYVLHLILPSKVDPLVNLMKVEKVPDSTYDMIGGLDQQIKEIKEIHSRKMNLMRGIDLKKIAEKMNGASGAELKAVCTEAGMFALRERRVHVTQEDFEMAVAKVMKKETEKNMSLRKLWK